MITKTKFLWLLLVLLAFLVGTIVGAGFGRKMGWVDARRMYRWDLCSDLEGIEKSLSDADISRTMSPLRALIWAVGETSYQAKLSDFGRELTLQKRRAGSTAKDIKTAEPSDAPRQ